MGMASKKTQDNPDITMENETRLVWQLKSFDDLSNEELYGLLALRSEVFVVEQACAYPDLDGKDQQSLHLMAWRDDALLAYARLLPPGLSYDTASIGRIVTCRAARSTGLGRLLLRRALTAVAEVFGQGAITISAQAHLEKFYGEFGFGRQGAPYLEDGIPHIKMISLGLPAGNLG